MNFKLFSNEYQAYITNLTQRSNLDTIYQGLSDDPKEAEVIDQYTAIQGIQRLPHYWRIELIPDIEIPQPVTQTPQEPREWYVAFEGGNHLELAQNINYWIQENNPIILDTQYELYVGTHTHYALIRYK